MAGLLTNSDDSDAPEFDLRLSRRRKLDKRWQPMSISYLLFIFLISATVIFLSIFSWKSAKQISRLENRIDEILQLTKKVEDMQIESKRLQYELEIMRGIPSNGTQNLFVYDLIDQLQNKIAKASDTALKAFQSAEGSSHRLSMVEQRCLAVCQLDSREKQRRREASTDFRPDQIVFNRNTP